MKKRYFIYFFILSVFSIITGCKTSVKNSFTIKNLAIANVILNFRAQAITITAGGTVTINEIPHGTYDYNTTYYLPAGTTSYSANGDVTGQVVINADTRILLIYSSTLDASGVYTVSATITNSDNQSTSTTGP